MKVQRLRVTFSRGEDVEHISHLDIMRYWARAFRQAGLPVAYSQGHNPTPKLSLAVPLPVGVTSSCELMDVYLSERVSPFSFMKSLSEHLPAGFQVLAVREVGLGLPSLQSQVRWAEYEIEVVDARRQERDVRDAIRDLLGLTTLPWQHRREQAIRRYDLRPLIEDIWLAGVRDGAFHIGMRLSCGNAATGRPEQVMAALGFPEPPKRIHRSNLFVEETSPGRRARRLYDLIS